MTKLTLTSKRQATFPKETCEALGVAGEVVATDRLASAKPGFVDRLIHGAYTGATNEMVTFENAASKLKSVRVL